MNETNERTMDLQDHIGFQLGGFTKLALKHDMKKADRKQRKASKKAEWNAMSDEEKLAYKKKRAFKIGAGIGAGLAIAGAACGATLKIISGHNKVDDDLVEIEDTEDTSNQEVLDSIDEYPED